MFADWISPDNLRSWIAENVSRDSFFCLLLLQQHFYSELLTQMIFDFDVIVSLSLFIQTKEATESCYLKI